MNRLIPLLAVLVVSAPTLGAAADSIWIEGDVLQVKRDRLYFNHGLEERIYRNCRYVVHRGSDSIYSGCVESSYPGVSFSYPTDGHFDTIPAAALSIWLQRARVDTVSPIVLGHLGYIPEPVNAGFGRSDSESAAGGRNPVEFRRYESQFEMSLAFQGGALDGFVSYRRYGPGDDDVSSEGQPAPFFVAMVPNPSHEVNRNGFLTTSLYYRLDPERMPLYFDGDEIHPFHGLSIGGDTAARPYPYDPGAGREVLQNMRTRSRNLTIGASHPMFEKIAGYYADIVSRDRYLTSIVPGNIPADVDIVAVPLAEEALPSLRFITEMLAADTVPGMSVNETIAIVDSYLDMAAAAEDQFRRDHYCSLAENALRDDIGVFPLFRPTMFFTARRSLLGDPFDERGYLDLAALTKVRLPEFSEECGP